MQNITQTQLEFPMVMGQPYETIPDDLFIPPNALELCLETFSGPMDLLLLSLIHISEPTRPY